VLFDRLVTGQVMASNPAISVRGPQHVIGKGKTPVLNQAEDRVLFEAINHKTDEEGHWVEKGSHEMAIAELCDRALIGVMVYSFARVGAMLGMNVGDYYKQGKRWSLRLHEKGGRHREVPAHHKLEKHLGAYRAAGGLAGRKGEPLFRSLDRQRGPTGRRLAACEAPAMIRCRARDAGVGNAVCCPAFRATAITDYLASLSLSASLSACARRA
jgi:integrase